MILATEKLLRIGLSMLGRREELLLKSDLRFILNNDETVYLFGTLLLY
jgi:hypothetical protein